MTGLGVGDSSDHRCLDPDSRFVDQYVITYCVHMADLEDRVAALEAVVRSLTSAKPGAPRSLRGELFLLEELQQRFPDGAVAYAGHVTVADGPTAWQWGRPAVALLEQDWESSATALGALGHPVRLRLLQLVLTGARTSAELADDEELGTTGQLYHHLKALMSAGWLQSAGRGRYAVPPQRVVPLLVIVSATEG